MSIRHKLLRTPYHVPRFRGRDRLVGIISRSFVIHPTQVTGKLKMALDVSEWIQLELLVSGAAEPLTISLIESLVKEGDTIIDIGAHVGHHALVAAHVTGSKGRVYAFDPQPYNCDRIAQNALFNNFNQIIVVCAAAGDKDGFTSFPLQSERDRARLSLAADGPNDLDVHLETAIRRLDNFIANKKITSTKLLKVDVEGFELEVFQGLGEQIHNCDNIIFELLEDADEVKNKEIFSILDKASFILKDVMGNNWQPGLELPENNVWACRIDQS